MEVTRTIAVALLVFSLSVLAVADARSQIRVESFSGSGQAGFANSDGQVGQFNRPHGLAVDGKGNIYVSDRGNHAIRVVTANGDIRTLAGTGKEGNADGPGASASFRQPIAVAVDKSGSVYVADRDNHVIRLIDPSGKVGVLVGSGTKGFVNGPALSAQFNEPYGVALSPDEKTLYVADYLNHAIRAIDLATKQVTTLAGNGTSGFANGVADKAQFNQPYNVKVDANGRLYVPDQNNHAIRRIDPDGTVSTLAGNGQSGFADGKPFDARFNNPTGLGIAADGTVYVADRNNHRIRAISPAGEVTTIAGDGAAAQQDGPAQAARFNRPIDIVLASDGSLVVSEENNHRLRKILLR
jgi:DNA-binding beta-propeller fold protein YncE